MLVGFAAMNGRGTSTTAAVGAPAVSAPSGTAPQVTAPSAAAPAASAPAAAPQPAAPAGPATSMSDGTYEVGVDIAAGRYTTTGPDRTDLIPNYYWERSKDDSGELRSIIANDNLSGSVSVKKGEFVKLSGGCTWTKQ